MEARHSVDLETRETLKKRAAPQPEDIIPVCSVETFWALFLTWSIQITTADGFSAGVGGSPEGGGEGGG